MAMSILHRVTGGALYFGTLLVAWWLIAAATSEAYFDLVTDIYGSWFGRLVLFGYSWALIHHTLGGIRHLIWDTGAALEKHTASRIAWVNVVLSIVLTVLVWVAGYAVRGGL
jgi:succinate dehydrogenase / fumarate reductase cytochrome b subunit